MASPKREVAAAVYPDPQLLYVRDEFHRTSPLRFLLGPIAGFAFGACTHLYTNSLNCRPWWAGLPRTLTYGTIGGFVFYHVKNYIEFYTGYRDQVHKHYIKLHPEEFPAPPKIKIADTFDPWYPNRAGVS